MLSMNLIQPGILTLETNHSIRLDYEIICYEIICVLFSIISTSEFAINSIQVGHYEHKWYSYAAGLIAMDPNQSNIPRDIYYCSDIVLDMQTEAFQMEHNCYKYKGHRSTHYILILNGISVQDLKQVCMLLYALHSG